MIQYTVIDRESWPRREYFEHYLTAVPCTYSMTVKLDITPIRQSGQKLYPTMLYHLTREVNRHEQFRMAFRENGELVLFDTMLPCYTVFQKDTETFTNLWTEFCEDFGQFCARYEKDVADYGAICKMNAKPGLPENAFTVSMIPWTTFEGFHLQLQPSNYLIPIFTMGKFYEENSRCLLPLALQVHHAVCDGFHACRFLNGLQDAILCR